MKIISNFWLFTLTFSIIVYYLVFINYIPNEKGLLGKDYEYFLPQLLESYYWVKKNGVFEVQWFTPTLGGGIPKFPNPQSITYSFSTFLLFFFNPLNSIQLNFLIFAIVGCFGMFFLLRKKFELDHSIAFLGALLFLFNDFYSTRMIGGHLTYQSFMLLPIFLILILNQFSRVRLTKQLLNIIGGAFIFSYFIYSGGIHLIPQYLLISLSIILLWGIKNKQSISPYLLNGFLIFLLGCLLSLAKVTAIVSYISRFPRNFYPLPGIDKISSLLVGIINSLFFRSKKIWENFSNYEILLAYNEFTYGIGLIPLLIFIGVPTYLLFKSKSIPVKASKHHLLFGIPLTLILITPLAINYYQPSWNSFLKSLPILRNSSNLFRWISIYIPITIIASCILLRRLKKVHVTYFIVALGSIIIIGNNYLKDRDEFKNENFDPKEAIRTYQQIKNNNFKTTISQNQYAYQTEARKIEGNSLWFVGASQLFPYEPIFGYNLEDFPGSYIKKGRSLMEIKGQFLNTKNPTCFVFPQANNCQAGDLFNINSKRKVIKFLSFRPIDFKQPLYQKLANWTSIMSIIFCLLGVFIYLICVLFRKLPKN